LTPIEPVAQPACRLVKVRNHLIYVVFPSRIIEPALIERALNSTPESFSACIDTPEKLLHLLIAQIIITPVLSLNRHAYTCERDHKGYSSKSFNAHCFYPPFVNIPAGLNSLVSLLIIYALTVPLIVPAPLLWRADKVLISNTLIQVTSCNSRLVSGHFSGLGQDSEGSARIHKVT
jgi:hypothetical protein